MLEQTFPQSPGHQYPAIIPSGHVRELWRMRGATDDLCGLAIETSFGHAFALELDHELVLLHLQPSIDVLIAYADRIQSALLAQGWQGIPPQSFIRKDRA